MGLVTWERVKTALSLQDSEQTETEKQIEAASREARNIIGRELQAADYVETYDGPGGRILLLKNGPIISIDEIIISGSRDWSADPLDSGEYSEFNADAGAVRRYGADWPTGEDNIRVSYRAGFEVIPEEVQNAIIEIIAWNMRRFAGGGNSIGVKTKIGDTINTTFETIIPANPRRILESLRWPK